MKFIKKFKNSSDFNDEYFTASGAMTTAIVTPLGTFSYNNKRTDGKMTYYAWVNGDVTLATFLRNPLIGKETSTEGLNPEAMKGAVNLQSMSQGEEFFVEITELIGGGEVYGYFEPWVSLTNASKISVSYNQGVTSQEYVYYGEYDAVEDQEQLD